MPGERSTDSKADRALPLAAQAEGGAVKLRRDRWNKDCLDELEMFPYGHHDDQVDAASLALARWLADKSDLWADAEPGWGTSGFDRAAPPGTGYGGYGEYADFGRPNTGFIPRN